MYRSTSGSAGGGGGKATARGGGGGAARPAPLPKGAEGALGTVLGVDAAFGATGIDLRAEDTAGVAENPPEDGSG